MIQWCIPTHVHVNFFYCPQKENCLLFTLTKYILYVWHVNPSNGLVSIFWIFERIVSDVKKRNNESMFQLNSNIADLQQTSLIDVSARSHFNVPFFSGSANNIMSNSKRRGEKFRKSTDTLNSVEIKQTTSAKILALV